MKKFKVFSYEISYAYLVFPNDTMYLSFRFEIVNKILMILFIFFEFRSYINFETKNSVFNFLMYRNIFIIFIDFFHISNLN